MIKRFLDAIATLNSTNAVVVTGITATLATAARYLLGGVHVGPFGFDAFNPDGDWLVFCAAVMGVATTQFGIKRTTDADYQRAKNEGKATTAVTAEQATVTGQNVAVNATEVQPPTQG